MLSVRRMARSLWPWVRTVLSRPFSIIFWLCSGTTQENILGSLVSLQVYTYKMLCCGVCVCVCVCSKHHSLLTGVGSWEYSGQMRPLVPGFQRNILLRAPKHHVNLLWLMTAILSKGNSSVSLQKKVSCSVSKPCSHWSHTNQSCCSSDSEFHSVCSCSGQSPLCIMESARYKLQAF